MRVKITKPGLFDSAGKEIAVGTVLTMKAEPTKWGGRYTVLDEAPAEPVAVTNPAGEDPSATKPTDVTSPHDDGPKIDPEKGGEYIVSPTSPGWFIIYKDGEPVTKSLREKDVEEFEAAEDKAAFVEAHKAEA